MKKIVTYLLMLTMVVLFASQFFNITYEKNEPQLIRLHVIANSNTIEDQDLKYRIRDEIVKTIKEEFKSSNSIEHSRDILVDRLPEIKRISERVIEESGAYYNVEVKYGEYSFPTKYYGDFSLPAGDYEAVRVVIGQGLGKNWWCVLFPPLCFVDGHTNKVMTKAEIKKEIDNSLKQKKVKIKPAFKVVEVIKDIKKKIGSE